MFGLMIGMTESPCRRFSRPETCEIFYNNGASWSRSASSWGVKRSPMRDVAD